MGLVTLEFEGYYTDDDLPVKKYSCSGIYAVYVGEEKNSARNLKKLLYIGESNDVGYRPGERHGKYTCWRSCLESSDDKLFYSFAKVDSDDRERVEAALIRHHQPPCNEEHKERFNYYKISIECLGHIEHLDKEIFTVEQEA